jgi:hypothetical protein
MSNRPQFNRTPVAARIPLPTRGGRRAIGFTLILACLCGLGTGRAEDARPAGQDDPHRAALHLLPAETVLMLHVDGPKRLVENTLVKDVTALVKQSVFRDEVLRRLDNPQLQQMKQFLEFTLNKPWDQALEAMTAQGVTLGLGRTDGGFTPTTAILACDNDKTVREIKDAIFGVVFNNAGGPKKMLQADYRGVPAFQLDEGHLAFSGTRVLFTNKRVLLEQALDRLLDPAKRTDFRLAKSLDWTQPEPGTGAAQVEGAARRPVFTTWLNLEAARQDEKFRKGLELPTDNVQAMFLLGGYVDLLRRAKFASAALFADEGRLEFSLRTDVGREGMIGTLAGFFAPPTGEATPPRLEVAGEVASLSWTRDYGTLWETREQLLTEASIKKLEEESKRATLLGTPGALEVFGGLGREWNLVVTLPEETGYKHPAKPQYPSGALLISLKDEALFREKFLAPINKFLDNPGFGAFMTLSTETHAGVELRHAKFLLGNAEPAEGSSAPNSIDRALRSFDPVIAVYRGRFLFATNLALAKKVIDARDKEAVADAAASNAGSDRISLGPVAEIAEYYKADVLRDVVLKTGLTVDEATAEFARYQDLLRRLGSLRRETRLGDDVFEIRHVIGETPKAGG